jgi:predicted enzyme related to lactoylglutathione lyase
MPSHVDGIGGAFVYASQPAKLASWYNRALGLKLKGMGGGVHYQVMEYRSLRNPRKKLSVVFAIFPASGRLSKVRNQAMVNFRVKDLRKLVAHLKRIRARVDPVEEGADGDGMGLFTHLIDPEGNRVELWEPSTGV